MAQAGVGHTALITGASCGIGRALAKVLAERGFALVLAARNRARLEEVAAGIRNGGETPIEIALKDLSVAGAAAELVSELEGRGLKPDVLVNNAGMGVGGPFAESDLEAQLKLLQLNIVSLTHLTRLLLPGMLARGWGRVMNVASIAAFFPGPLTATYNASKAYVLSFSEALACELRGTGVSVTALCPGPTRTEFHARAGLNGARAFDGQLMDATAVAQIGVDAMMEGKPMIVAGWANRLRMVPIRLLPRGVLARFSMKYHQVRQGRK